MKAIIKVMSVGLLVTLLAGAFLFAFPSSVAHAEGFSDEPPTSVEKLGLINHKLEAAFERQQANLDRQLENIQKMSTLTGKAQERIEGLKANGKDVTDLEEALASFENKIGEINASHLVAVELIADHAGFDDNGQVTNPVTAKTTIQNLHDALKTTRRMMGDSSRALREALRTFRAVNAPVQTIQP